MYFDILKVVTYNALFNFLIGTRGVGKSYSMKKHVIKRFKKHGKQFIYLRRYKTELKESAYKYFDDIILNNEFPDDKIEFKNDKYYLNGKLMGYAIPLTRALYYKSSSFPLVDTIIYEEFLVDEGSVRYLSNEVESFLDFYETIARTRDVKVYFLANSIKANNPYFNYFNLSLPYKNKIKLFNNGDILLCMAVNDEFIEYKNKTRFGNMIKDTEYGNYSIESKFKDMNDDKFIDKKSNHTKYYFTLLIKNQKYGVWIDYYTQRIYISNDVLNDCPINIAFSKNEHNPSSILFKANKSYFNNLQNLYRYGFLYFESKKIKMQCAELIDIL